VFSAELLPQIPAHFIHEEHYKILYFYLTNFILDRNFISAAFKLSSWYAFLSWRSFLYQHPKMCGW